MTAVSEVKTPHVDQQLLDQLLASQHNTSDSALEGILDRIKPVVRKEGELFYIDPVDPRKVTFIWDPTFTEPATGLTELIRIFTLHTWGYYGFFKPSLAEVVNGIPTSALRTARAFEIIGPHDVHDLNRQNVAVNAGYHVAVVILYR